MNIAAHPDSFQSKSTLTSGCQTVTYFALAALKDYDLTKIPFSLRILLENLLRHEDGRTVTPEDIKFLAQWNAAAEPSREIAYMPARVLMQDFTGVPAIVDLAAMRDAMRALGGNPDKDQPPPARRARHRPLRPGRRIRHHPRLRHQRRPRVPAQPRALRLPQVGPDRLPQLLRRPPRHGHLPPGQPRVPRPRRLHDTSRCTNRTILAYPDTLVGTDSHTTMVNGLGVLGWGVGGIEAEAAMLGQPVSMLVPQVVGFKLTGKLKEGTTATDLVLTVTESPAQARRRRQVRRVLRPRHQRAPPRRPRHHRQHGPRVRRHLRHLPRRQGNPRLPPPHRPHRSPDRTSSRPTCAPRASSTPRRPRSHLLRHPLARPRDRRAQVAGPKRPQDRILLSCAADSFQKALPTLLAVNGNKAAVRQMVRWEGEGGHMSATGDVTSSLGAPAPGTPDNLPSKATSSPSPPSPPAPHPSTSKPPSPASRPATASTPTPTSTTAPSSSPPSPPAPTPPTPTS